MTSRLYCRIINIVCENITAKSGLGIVNMKNFFKSMGVFVKALPHFLLFEFLFKLILAGVGAPLLDLSLKLTMKAANIKYLTDESMLIYLKSPVTIFIVLILLFLSGFFAFVELCALAACFTCYSKNEKITVGGMLITGLRGFKKAFRGLGILRFMLFMLCMPVAHFTLSSGMFMAPLLPILRRIFIKMNSSLAIIVYIFVQMLFIFLIVCRSYSLHYLVLTKKNFSECVKASYEKISRRRIRMAFTFLLWTLFILLVTAAATFGISFIIVFFIKGLSRPDTALRGALRVLRYAIRVFTAVSAFLSAPAIMCWLTGRFLGDLKEDETINIPDRDRKKMELLPKTLLIAGLALGGLLLNISFISGVYKGNIKLNAPISGTQVSAHRGASYSAPENTKYAFEKAISSGADYIELDVQLTKDDQLVVFHDKVLDRTTDGSGKLTNYTYAELQELSAGEWFGKEYKDAKIMLLSDVLKLVGHKVLLNIEIKNIGNVDLIAEKTVELIKEYDILDSCYVTSFSYNALTKVKEIEPKIKIALIANLATSTANSELPDIDAVSMNYIFVNQGVVNTVHQNGKKIFVWTVDREEDIRSMLALGVDNIITNRPDKAKEIVDSKKVGDTILHILEMIFSS